MREYEQEVEGKDFIDPWFKFTGVNVALAWQLFDYESYTWLD